MRQSGTALVSDRVRWITDFLRENNREEMAREVERIDELRRLADAALEAMGGEVERLRQGRS